MDRGLLLSLDGIDGTGKSTQCRMLVDWLNLRGTPAILCNDPGGTGRTGNWLDPARQKRRHFPRGSITLHGEPGRVGGRIIRPALESGKTVISDRFVLANVVYQGHAGGIDPAELWKVGYFSTNDLLPSMTFVLDLPIEEAVRRRGRDPDRMELCDAEYRERLRRGYLSEAQRRPDRFRIIDASASVDEIQDRLARKSKGCCRRNPLYAAGGRFHKITGTRTIKVVRLRLICGNENGQETQKTAEGKERRGWPIRHCSCTLRECNKTRRSGKHVD